VNAYDLCSREHTPDDWALHHRNLGGIYLERLWGDKAENLENAIYHLRQALQVHTREIFPMEWADIQASLANAYWARVEGDKRSNQEQAIFHLQQSLDGFDPSAYPFQWARAHYNLGHMHEHRIAASQNDRVTLASEHINKALDIFTPEVFPVQNRQCHNALGILHFDAGNWREAHAECEAAIEATKGLLKTAYTDVAQRAEVAATSQLYARDAFCLLRLGRTANALLRLEQGKMRVLAQALAISDLDLSTLPEAQRQALEAERQTMRAQEARMRLSGTTGLPVPWDIRESLETTHARLAQLVAWIGIDHADFMPTGLDLPQLLALIPKGGALVSPLVTSQGSAVFVVPHGADAVTDDHVILLDGFTDGDLRTVLWGKEAQAGWFAAYLDYRISASAWFGRKWFQAIETAGRELWTFLLGPVHERLTRLGLEKGAAVLLMPQGGLGLLPLHAAWRTVDGQKRYFLDDWAITYAPSGYTLSVSRKRIQETTRHGRALLTVVNPTRDLPFTVAEGKAVAALFTEARSLAEDEATVDAVMEAALVCNYLHFSCHGFYNWQDAMQSGLVLAEGKPLTMAEIIAKLDLGRARLITLSACETGLTEIRQSPDEYLGLPAGFLQAGAPAVISTLWPVADLSTMLLMQRFYRNLLGDGGNAPLSLASALREAQQWLRTATAEELSGWGDGFGEAFAALPPAQTPFEHPYHWAAFTFSGA
jgi:CHAT domain-containing protein/tetratricopeptide (TPR) repeat protein